ncbi:hypothetical protein ACIBQ0_00310 [Nocardia nova]|uniref:hypothetical protein n=1 Tax=Nocardia nova TaxID=37330 RepID=UPI00379BCA09
MSVSTSLLDLGPRDQQALHARHLTLRGDPAIAHPYIILGIKRRRAGMRAH